MHDISFQATVSQKKNSGNMLADIMDIQYDPTLEEIVFADQGHVGVVYSADMTLRRIIRRVRQCYWDNLNLRCTRNI
jgi:hypothetical protein